MSTIAQDRCAIPSPICSFRGWARRRSRRPPSIQRRQSKLEKTSGSSIGRQRSCAQPIRLYRSTGRFVRWMQPLNVSELPGAASNPPPVHPGGVSDDRFLSKSSPLDAVGSMPMSSSGLAHFRTDCRLSQRGALGLSALVLSDAVVTFDRINPVFFNRFCAILVSDRRIRLEVIACSELPLCTQHFHIAFAVNQ